MTALEAHGVISVAGKLKIHVHVHVHVRRVTRWLCCRARGGDGRSSSWSDFGSW